MVSSFLPPQGFGLPSLKSKASSTLPSPQASVSNYVNQQLAGLVAGTSPVVGPSDRGASGIDSQLSTGDAALNPVQQGAATVSTKIKESNDRIRVYQQAAQRRRGLSQDGGVAYGDMRGAGSAYTPDGTLSDSRNRALALASSYIGTPYRLGGTNYRGIDCSGLVMLVYKQLGFDISQHSATWQGRNIPGVRTSLANLRPGDLVAWRDGSHIAIYAGNGQIIEAANPRSGTRRTRLWASPNAVYGIALRLPGE